MKLLLTSVLFALFPVLASAIPITGGTITIGHINDAFNFSGPDFSVSGAFSLGNWDADRDSPYKPGATLGVNGTEIGLDFAPGSATVGATSFPSVAWGSTANLLPPSIGSQFYVSGPAITLDAGAGTYHSTFTFNGSLCGIVAVNPNHDPQPCDVGLPGLSGSGIVDVNIISVGGFSDGARLEFTNAVYTFTPEPQTWMLALLGIVVISGWRLKMARGGNWFRLSHSTPREPPTEMSRLFIP